MTSSIANPFSRLQNRRIPFGELSFNAYVGGRGASLLLIHGSGPGASSIGNWRPVLDDLAARYRVMAIDLIGFGESDRKRRPPYFDFPLWLQQARVALESLDGDAVGVIGHSLGGAIALTLTATEPRVRATLTTGTMGASMPANPYLAQVWRCPRSRDAMRALAGCLIHDQTLVTDAYLDARLQVIGDPEYQAYFDTMFSGPCEPYIAAARLDEATLGAIQTPVVMLHGRNDLPIPAEHGSIPLLSRLRRADLLFLHDCGHSVAMERPEAFLSAARMVFQ